MKNYSGPKPCIACGTPGSEVARISVDSLCWKCKELIALGKKTKQANESFKEYVSVGIYPCYNSGSGFGDRFFKAIKVLAASISDDSKDYKESVSIGSFNSNSRTNIICTKSQYDGLSKLYFEVNDIIKEAYNKGKADGASLLISLNNGDITLQKFDESLKR